MSEKKDYLSELAKEVDSNKKIESFQEEKVERVQKPKRNINPMAIIIPGVIVLVLLIVGYFVFLAPKIEMPNFLGQTKADVSAWIKQQSIDTQGIVMKEEYNFDNDEGVIIDQSIEAGKKIKNDAIITFTASLGADPDELVDFPDNVLSLTKDDINEWISTNKLSKTKVSSAYSETVQEGYVISFDLKGIDKADFKRGTNVTFTVSKGPQPAGTVTVEDFSTQTRAYVENWAKTKKVNVTFVESFSDKVAADGIISQSIAKDKTMKENETITITVSKGKGVTIPDLSTYTKEQFETWKTNKDNATISIVETERYSETGGYILSQSQKKGTKIGSGDTLEVTVNLGLPRINIENYIGKQLQDLIDWCNEERHKGSDMYAGSWASNGNEPYSYTYRANQVISIACSDYSTGASVSCSGNLPLDARFDVVVSKGIMYDLKAEDVASGTATADLFASLRIPFVVENANGQMYDGNTLLTTGDKIYETGHNYILK